ncbi:MAG: GNAT family N-acetyltransferase [Pseudomonadota bacterium]
MKLEFHAVVPERWADMEALIEGRGGPHYCWCMAWRRNEFKNDMPGKAGKKASMKRRVDDGVPIGLLGYRAGDPVAWCSVAPKTTYRPLGGKEVSDKVWSLACFFVKREYRGRGMTQKLIAAAAEYAKDKGACWLEAYPVAADSPSYRFMGICDTFAAMGFEFVETVGTRRNLMRLKLDPDA